MRNNPLLKVSIILLILFNAQIGCKKDETAKEIVIGPTTFSPNAVIISKNDWNEKILQIDTVGGIYTFSSNPGLSEGNFMISEEGEGCLRKVTNIETGTNGVIVYTEFASLCDVIEKVSAHKIQSITSDKKSKPEILEKGVTIKNDVLKNTDNTNLHYDIDWIVYDKDGNFNTTYDQITVSGSYGMSSQIESSIVIEKFELKNFIISYTITESSNISVLSRINSSLFEKERKLMRQNLSTFILFPGCVITPVIELYGGIEITNTGTIGIQVEKSKDYSASLEYNYGVWSTNKSIVENEFSVEPILNDVVAAKAYLKPKLLLKIDGVISPKLEAELYNQLSATLSLQGIDWEISKGFNLGIGIEMKVFNKTYLDYSVNFFDINRIIDQGSIPIGKPQVTTATVTNVSTTSAETGGNVTFAGNSTVTMRGVCWSTSEDPTINNDHTNDGSGIGIFTSTMAGLSPGTDYFVRAYATNSSGTSYGENVPFRTDSQNPELPSVETSTYVTDITQTSATCGGNVTSDGGHTVTARGICWSTSSNPDLNDSHTNQGNGTGTFSSTLTGLSPATPYYFRAYATNINGTAFGDNVQFITIDENSTNLVAYYPFSGNANDQSGNNNNGTVNGAMLTSDRNGNSNSAYQFDGTNDYIKVSDASMLDITHSITLAAWIKLDAGSSNNDQKIITKFPPNAYQITVLNGKFVIQLFDGNSWRKCTGTTELNKTDWYFVVGRYDYSNGKLSVFVNGNKESEISLNITISSTSAPLTIGNYSSGYQWFKGKIDEIRIYNSAISDQLIHTLFNSK